MTDAEIEAHLELLGCTKEDVADDLDSEATIEAYLAAARETCCEAEMQPQVEDYIRNAINTVNLARQRNRQA